MQTYKPLKILQASAGSGKTFSLAAHYLSLLFSGENKYREILAVTFTNKATAEMKERILEVLKALTVPDGEAGVRFSADEIKRIEKYKRDYRPLILKAHSDLTPETLQQKADKIYRQILHDYSRFSVNTIDGFVQKVIRSFTYELGLDAGYRLEMNIEKVKNDLADRLNKTLDRKPDLLEWITSLAMERIRDNKNWNYRGALLDLSGELFKERYAPFEEALRDKDPAQVFKELKNQTRNFIADFEEQISGQTKTAVEIFEASGVFLDELKGKSRSPLANLPKIAAGDLDKIAGLEKLLGEPDEWQKGGLNSEVQFLYDNLEPVLAQLISVYKSGLLVYETAKAIDANLYYLRLMQEMGELLSTYREENQLLLISDAQNLLKGITIGKKNEPPPNASFVWEKAGNRYKHFLFDEFQDTSKMQWQNFLPLVQNAIGEPSGKYIDHLIVGDVKQSIYRWRGGDWNILLRNAKKDLKPVNITDDSLEENYRSAANIIDFNNFLFRHIPALLQANINNKVIEEGGEELTGTWWIPSGYHQIITDAYAQSQQLKAPSTPKGGVVEVAFLEVESNAYRPTQVKEKALQRLGETLDNWISTKKYTAGQICILVRSNTEAREAIEFLMQNQQQKPAEERYQILSGEALLIGGNAAVCLLINTFKAMVCKQDEAALYLANCIQLHAVLHQQNIPAETWMNLKAARPETMEPILPAELCRNWRGWQALPLTEITEKLIAVFGLQNHQQSLPFLLAFRDLVAQFSKTGERGISTFLSWWDEEGNRKALPSASQSNAVQVMTIHKSKGLAFDVVMLPFCSWNLDGMANSIFWVDTADTGFAELGSAPVHYKKALGKTHFGKAYFEELLYNFMDALNMLYVATTRTKNHLYITSPGQAAGKDEPMNISGDLIYHALKLYSEEISTEFNEGVFIDEPVLTGQNELQNEGWAFESYPISNRLNEALNSETVYEQLDLLSGNNSRRRGLILHDVLAQTTSMDDVDSVLTAMQQTGLFRQLEFAELKQLAMNVLGEPQLAELLSRPYKNVNEQTIIDGKGDSYRPDKVLLGDAETLIIDFKFTDEPKPAHNKQVLNYQNLLREMGYPNIRSYLYYGYLNELREVNG